MTSTILVAVLLAFALAACASTEVREQQACARWGITPDDPRFFACMDRMEAVHQTNVAASLGMLGAGTALLQSPPRYDVYVH